MTEEQRDQKIQQIKHDLELRLHEKAQKIKAVLLAFDDSNFVDNGKGQAIVELEAEKMTEVATR